MTQTPMTTYAALNVLGKRFAEGAANLVILIGHPGLMKTETIKRACRGKPLLHVTQKKTPIEFYRDLYEYRDALVLLDDVEPLLDDKDGQVLIRGLTETTPTKLISWSTNRKVLDHDGNEMPRSFTTSSRVFVIANKWRSGGIFAAIESRGLKFTFSPPWAEVYTEAGKWFHDQIILDYVYDNLGHMRHPDVRLLNNAVQMRKMNLPNHDWRDVFAHCMKVGPCEQVIRRLLAIPTMTQSQRIEAFKQATNMDRATFFRHLKRIKEIEAEPQPTRIIVSSVKKSGDRRKGIVK